MFPLLPSIVCHISANFLPLDRLSAPIGSQRRRFTSTHARQYLMKGVGYY
jgi:hypothetical protein